MDKEGQPIWVQLVQIFAFLDGGAIFTVPERYSTFPYWRRQWEVGGVVDLPVLPLPQSSLGQVALGNVITVTICESLLVVIVGVCL